MYRFLISFLLLILPFAGARAQAYRFYGADQLSSTMITTLCQDANGLLWIGTEHGLNRFDGYHFVRRTTQAEEGQTCPMVVTSLLSDREQRLWVGTTRSMLRYDKGTTQFRAVEFPNGFEPRVSSILQLKDGTLLAATSGYGLYAVDPETMQATQLEGYGAKDDNDYFGTLYQARDGSVWRFGTKNRITCRTPEGKLKIYTSPCGLAVSFFERDGVLYALCQQGLLRLSRNGGMEKVETSGVASHFTNATTDRQGNLYIGTRGDGLYWIQRNTTRPQRFQIVVGGFDLSRARIEAVFVDHQENLWVGCQQRGLLMIPLHRRSLFQTWSFAAQRQETGTCVSAIVPGEGVNVWCTVQGDGVYGFDEMGKIVAHPHAPQGVETMYRDPDGNYWLGTTSGLWTYDPVTGRATPVPDLDGLQVNTMTDLGNGQLAVSAYGTGLYIINKVSRTSVRHLTMHDTDTVGRGRLTNDWIYALDTDPKGRLWIGTTSGVSCYDPQTGSFRTEGWDVLADREACTALRVLRNGDVLLGMERGMQRWTKKHQMTAEPNTEPLRNITVSYIAEDQKGDLWLSTNDGIWHWNPKQGKLVAYVESNGLQTREFVQGAGLQTTDGHILFGTADGIACFQPDSLRSHRPEQSTIHLTALVIAGEQANILTRSNGRNVMQTAIDSCHHFRLSYLDASFQLEFSLLDFADAADVVFEHRIDGEQRWQNTGLGKNTIAFNHLAPGTYRIQVRALTAGTYTDTETYTIEILPPWWRSTGAYWIYLLLLVTILAYAAITYRKNIRRQLDEDKMQFLINATHDIRSPLTLILSPLEKLRSRSSDKDDQAELDIIHHNAQRILALVNQILDLRKIDRQQMRLHPVDIDLTALIEAICHMHDFAAQEHGFTFRFVHPDEPIHIQADPQQLEKVVANLLSNAFKYTPDGGDITVELNSSDDSVRFSVTDTGPGIPPAAIPHIFERFYQSRQTKQVPGTGIGLHLCHMIVDMHGGKISVQNRTDGQTGSRFTVELPKQSAVANAEQTETPAPVVKPVSKGEVGNILVVDDDTDLSAYVARELSPHFRCQTAKNGNEALQTLLTAPEGAFAAVVSDVMMPEMDGFTLLRLIRTNTRIAHLPVVMLTSKTDIASRLEGLERGADAYLAKPFTTSELTATLRNLLAQRQRLRGKYSGAQQAGVERAEVPEQRGNDELLMDRIMQSINKHLADSEFTVDQLCTEVGISRAHLHRKMKEMTGLPITEFIRNIRLEQAARLLREQKLNITQVAYTVGFSNLGYFSTMFRKHFGVAPRDFVTNN